MKKYYKISAIAFLVLFSLSSFAQGVIKGKILDASTDESLIGATILLEGTTTGTTTDLSGSFTLEAKAGSYKVVIRFVGYNTIEKEITVTDGKTIDLGTLKMDLNAVGLAEVKVVASMAVDRKTPVALSTIAPVTIEEKLGTQEFPEILKSTPGIYATKQGGAFGDARVNIRGFDSRNVAVMINGVPVNDMEGGKVYWSNWAGLADVTRQMQVQRGLGAAKVAVPSIGGTINVVTNTTEIKKGGNIITRMGNDGYQKFGLTLSSGLTKNGWSASFMLTKTTGDGYVDGTQFEGYSYFFNLTKKINSKHMIAFTVFGAPQWHGQRYYPQAISKYKESDRGIRYNPFWGYKNGQITYARENYYHKPQAILNHFWKISSRYTLSTSIYGSYGTGGGVRGYGDTDKFDNYLREGQIDFDRIVDENVANGYGGSQTVLASSVNNHSWFGFISTLRYDKDNLSLSLGLDGRYYKGEHYYEITDLLGGKFYIEDGDINNPSKLAKVGDRANFYNDGLVSWLGTFAQAEYTINKLSVFVNASVSNKRYKRIDYYTYLDYDPIRKTDWEGFWGYSFKGGGTYNFNENHFAFINTGYFERQPDFNSVFLNYQNILNEDAVNEKVFSFEAGYGYRSKKLTLNLNLYSTKWMDKTFIRTRTEQGQLLRANILGVDALHRGIELDFVAKPFENLTITGMASVADWKWLNDIKDAKIFDEEQNEVASYDLYIKDLKVGNSAQMSYALGMDYELMENLKLGVEYTYFDNLYAEFDPLDRSDINDRSESWKLPAYGLFDASLRYNFKINTLKATFYANVNNLFDTEYLSEADDGSGHDWSSAEVYYGWGRSWTMGLKIRF